MSHTKTLAIILHFNSTQHTDTLYQLLKPYERDDYDLQVWDNGSEPGRSSRFTTKRLEKNIYFGGAFDLAMKYFLDHPEYDSFLFINSDIILQANTFIKDLREKLFEHQKMMVISPCVIQSKLDQGPWKQTHCWHWPFGRPVRWVDPQFSLMKRELVEVLYPLNNSYGFGIEIFIGLACEARGWAIVVYDNYPVLHVGAGTVHDNLHLPEIASYGNNAYQEMIQQFTSLGLMGKLQEMHDWARNYTYNS